MKSEIELLRRQIIREREARKQAESLLENKSKELFDSNQKLVQLNIRLEDLVGERTYQLEKEKEQLKQMIDEHPLPMLVSTGERNMIVNANKKALQLFKCELNDLIDREVPDLVKSEAEFCEEDLNGTFYTLIDQVKHELRCHCSNIQIDEIPGKLILLEDISEKSEMLDQITKKEKQYKNLVENSSDVIFICDLDGKFKYVNPMGFKLTGFDEEELMDTHFFKLVRSDYQKKLRGFYNFQVKNKIQSTYIEFPIICKDGKELWLGQTVDINTNSNGDIEFFALSREISDRIKYEKAMMRSEEKFRSIIENLELGLLEVDRNGIILKAYPQFCKLIGYSSEELVGQDPLQLMVDDENRNIILDESKKRKQGNSSVYEIKLFKKDKTPIWVMISGAPYYNEKNEVAGTVGIHLDITKRKLMEEELKEAKLLAENSLKSKDLFVANISHEIRTPLNAIMGMSQLLEQGILNQKQHQFVQAISKSSENLLMIVNDLLDFSKLEAGKMDLTLGSHNIYETITDVANLWGYKIEEKNIDFSKNISVPQKNYLYDATRLNGILSNLLHNALKFTEKGMISLNVEIVKEHKNKSVFLFKIEDTGIGISESQLAQIFESFVQAEPGIARKYGGTGLGLSISRNLIELMGSQLKVSSQLNVGTTFEFELTLEKQSESNSEKTKELIEVGLLKDLNVLLVEDNQFNQIMAHSILENWNVNVVIANNGKEAIEKIQEQEFDLILMDIQMPVMDGIQCSWKIRHDLKSTTPILALTANAMPNDVKKYLDVGMNGFVLKPFRQHELYISIKNVLFPDMNEKNPVTNGVNEKMKSMYSDEICDLSNLTKNCLGNEAFMRRMITVAIQEIGNNIIKLEENLNANKPAEIKNIAHSLKPTIQNVANKQAFELVRSVELDEPNETWKINVNVLISKLDLLKSELVKRNV
ncbi:PAS domain S-box protein [Fluviicola taffensis]|uniref:PAS domain S-box protein n=1 Tax=Fluviicola taffensis TaxID=191579 RepID=UPI00313849D6